MGLFDGIIQYGRHQSTPKQMVYQMVVPVSLPLTCVFTSDGHLVDLIPGAAKESFLYVQKALTDLQMTEYHYPNRFSMPKKKLITLFDRILDCNTGLK